jgi:phage terminase small subunit
MVDEKLPVKLNKRQEKFVLSIFAGASATQAAIDAGYSPKTAYSIGPRLLKNVEVQARLRELFDEVKDTTVMSVLERKQRLTEIARGRFSDFVDKGGGVNISPDDLHSAAIQSVRTRLELGSKDEEPALVTEVRLHDPVKAIGELNKMEGIYSETPLPGGNNYYIGAMNINALIADPKGELISRINRLAARIGEAEAPQEADPGEGGEAPL